MSGSSKKHKGIGENSDYNSYSKLKQELRRESILNLPVPIRKVYNHFRFYSFFWWGAFSFVIFQPLYLYAYGFPFWSIFLKGLLEAFFSLMFQNFWSHRADKNGNLKEYMILGNLFLIVGNLLLPFVRTIPMLFLLTFILKSGPYSDVFATSYIYRLSELIEKKDNNTNNYKDNYKDISESSMIYNYREFTKNYHNINLFAQYRKYGSIGWAFIAPLLGWTINLWGFGVNFQISAFIFAIISIWAQFKILSWKKIEDLLNINEKEQEKMNPNDNKQKNINKIGKKFNIEQFSGNHEKDKFLISLKALFKFPTFSALMVAFFIFSIANSITYQTQGIFYGLFANGDYIKIALTFSVAAVIEWPTMQIIAKYISKIGHDRMIKLVFSLNALRYFIAPFLLIFNANIIWAYLLQVATGVLFGMRLPTVTYTIHQSLPANKRTLGQGIKNTIHLFGSLTGSIIGMFLAFIIPNLNQSFLGIYWLAAFAAFMSSIYYGIIIKKIKKKSSVK